MESNLNDPLSADQLLTHVEMLARHIGPRPAGSPAERQARDYLRRALQDAGFDEAALEELPFPTPDTYGYMFFAPVLLTLIGNRLGALGRAGRLIGSAAGLFSAYHLWQSARANRQPLSFAYPARAMHSTANLIARIPAAQEHQQRVVLLGHTDTNKARFMPILLTVGTLTPLVNGLAQIAQALGSDRTAKTVQRLSALGLAAFLPLLLYDEKEGHIDGANDNATAVACLLGLGTHLIQQPLAHTDVWLVFTGAEETGCLGTHHLLDTYGDQLKEAWFIDFEMVGTCDVIYVLRHGISYLGRYEPDAESLRWAMGTSRGHPDLHVDGQSIVIAEEVGALRTRGYRGICLAGVGADGWLANWHQYSDNFANIIPTGLERAARFALAMMQTLDECTAWPG
jgi:hypothetical protein